MITHVEASEQSSRVPLRGWTSQWMAELAPGETASSLGPKDSRVRTCSLAGPESSAVAGRAGPPAVQVGTRREEAGMREGIGRLLLKCWRSEQANKARALRVSVVVEEWSQPSSQ